MKLPSVYSEVFMAYLSLINRMAMQLTIASGNFEMTIYYFRWHVSFEMKFHVGTHWEQHFDELIEPNDHVALLERVVKPMQEFHKEFQQNNLT